MNHVALNYPNAVERGRVEGHRQARERMIQRKQVDTDGVRYIGNGWWKAEAPKPSGAGTINLGNFSSEEAAVAAVKRYIRIPPCVRIPQVISAVYPEAIS